MPPKKKAKTAGGTVNAVLCGTGEYTTGYVASSGGLMGSKSDKKVGVVGLSFFEMRRLGKVGTIGMVGTNGTKFPGIRAHLEANISKVYNGLDVSCATYPSDDTKRQVDAYKTALDSLSPGDVTSIFTPDDSHYEIAKYAIQKKIHVLVTKPPVKTLAQHIELVKLAEENGVLVMVEYHKRFDPIYMDARNRINTKLGDFSYFNSFMSQPKFQLETFKAWAGKSSDISYYLNSHHIDLHAWSMQGKANPKSLTASGATGVAHGDEFKCPKGTEDTITLVTDWENTDSGNMGTAIYTASWSAPKADVHSQQRFHYMGHDGEISADQAHRGYYVTTHDDGFASVNPLYMSYLPGPDGHFNGHHGYGYKSLDVFVNSCIAVNEGLTKLEDLHDRIPTLKACIVTTAILEAGRASLDGKGKRMTFTYDSEGTISGYE
jgi:D-galacturonate reductase